MVDATPHGPSPTAHRVAHGAPLDALPYHPGNAPPGPAGVQGWEEAQAFLQRLSEFGVAEADRFVLHHRELRYRDVHTFFGAINPDPMLGGEDAARAQRQKLGLDPTCLPSSLADALREIEALDDRHVSAPLRALARYVQRALGICDGCDTPQLPEWADRSRMLLGQRAFMTRLMPAVLALLCKSLPEAYSAARPASVLMLSGELSNLPYHRLVGTMQLLVTVSTPFSFEGPWYPALVAAEEMQLLHAGVRMNVAPRLVDVARQAVDRGPSGWTGDAYTVWPGYEAFRRGWPESDACDTPQVVVSQTDMLATIIAFSLLVVEGLDTLEVPMSDEEAEGFWHLWRVFAVLKGIHPPGQPFDGSWVPSTLAEAKAFWRCYRSLYLTGPTTWSNGWATQAREQNPAGYALTSAHLRMIASLLKGTFRYLPVRESQWLSLARWFVIRLGGEEGAARVGVPPVHLGAFTRGLVEHLPRRWERLLDRIDPGIHVAMSRYALSRMVGQVYGERVVFPVPQTVKDLQRFVEQPSPKERIARQFRRRRATVDTDER
jgi:hypothetical protein